MKLSCSCAGCAAKLKPFTVRHFTLWAEQLVLDTLEPWVVEPFQADVARDWFRGFSEVWFLVPEGNAKTTLVSGFALYHAEHREQASVPVAASSREQAGIMYGQMEGFVVRSPYLHGIVQSPLQAIKGKLKLDVPRFTALEGYRRVNHYLGGRIQIYAADDATADGVIPTLALVDELHRHRNLKLYRTWAGKLQKRQGQLITISTAGEPGTEFEQARERIRQNAHAKVKRRGKCFIRVETPRLVLHEYAVPEDGDVEDLRLVKSANPLRAITVATLSEKISSDTMTLAHWKRMTCNIPTRASNAAITEIEWSRAKSDEPIPEGAPIWLGLDIAWKWDTTAAVPLWVRDETFRKLGAALIYTPPRDGSMLDIAIIQRGLIELHTRNPIHTVVMDPAYAADLAQWIRSELGSEIIERGQSAALAVVDYEKFMEGLRDGTLRHSGDDGLTRHALNAVARQDRYGATRFDRPAPTRNASEDQERRVIDALTAAAMVNAQAVVPAEPIADPFAIWA